MDRNWGGGGDFCLSTHFVFFSTILQNHFQEAVTIKTKRHICRMATAHLSISRQWTLHSEQVWTWLGGGGGRLYSEVQVEHVWTRPGTGSCNEGLGEAGALYMGTGAGGLELPLANTPATLLMVWWSTEFDYKYENVPDFFVMNDNHQWNCIWPFMEEIESNLTAGHKFINMYEIFPWENNWFRFPSDWSRWRWSKTLMLFVSDLKSIIKM